MKAYADSMDIDLLVRLPGCASWLVRLVRFQRRPLGFVSAFSENLWAVSLLSTRYRIDVFMRTYA